MLLAPVLLAAAVAAEASPNADFAPQYLPSLAVERAAGAIRVDGFLDDAGWREAARATGFAEVSPGDQVAPPVDSEAWITYDDDNLYVALIAYDDPREVRVSLRDRDNIFTDDYFGLMLDTYGDLGWGYEFFVNPLGIQGDLRLAGDGSEDISFDAIFASEGRVTDQGYQVELAIPFSSLRFPDRKEQIWRANFWRDHQREVRRRYAWAASDRDNPCWMCSWGTLTGMRGIEPGNNLEFLPAIVAAQSSARPSPTEPLDRDSASAEVSLSARYGISSSASAEIALNPDFSQVESDAGQIDVNETFALFFPERRPFFQEGGHLYSTWINAVYTRSINDPDAAAKLTAQAGRTSFLYLAALDAHSPLILPSEERSDFLLAGQSVSNIFRARRTYLEDSFVGLLLTDRRLTGDAGGSGSVFGIDVRHRLTTNWQLETQWLGSYTEEPNDTSMTAGLDDKFFAGEHSLAFDGESFFGQAIYASLERGGRLWNLDFDYWDYSPTFRSDNGFITRNDYRSTSLWSGLNFNPNGRHLVSWTPNFSVGRLWNHGGGFEDEWFAPALNFDLIGQVQLEAELVLSREHFRGETIGGIHRLNLDINARPTEFWIGGLEVMTGSTIWRGDDDPRLGEALELACWSTFKPTQRLEVRPSLGYARLEEEGGGDEIFSGWILRARTNLQFTRELSLRFVVQYDEFDERLDLEPLLTYRLNPFSVFYVGSTANLARPAEGENLQLDQRQFFAKLQYFFQV